MILLKASWCSIVLTQTGENTFSRSIICNSFLSVRFNQGVNRIIVRQAEPLSEIRAREAKNKLNVWLNRSDKGIVSI